MISYAQLTMGSLAKLGFFANAAIWMPVSALFGLGGLAGLPLVTLSGANVFGLTALVTALVIGLIFAIVGTVLFTLGGLLVRLLGDRAPNIELRNHD